MVSGAVDLLQLMNEHRTRKKYIDPELKKRDWLAKYIKEEVNSVKSDFNKKDFVIFDGAVEEGDRYIDYVLLDEDFSVLAIIESKRYSRDEKAGFRHERTRAILKIRLIGRFRSS